MKARNLLSIASMMVFGFAMMVFGAWASPYAGGYFMISFGSFASLVASTIIWGIWNLDISVRNAKPTVKLENQVNSLEKRKRERIDSVLRDLSDEDLLRLRQRLNDGTVRDEHLEDALIGEDGELVDEEKKR